MNISWLAGFYEGEGNPYNLLTQFGLMISQKEREVLELVQTSFGGVVREKSEGEGMHVWCIYDDDAVKLAKELLRYMYSPKKIEQLKKSLILYGYLEPRTQEEASEVAEGCAERKKRMRGYNKKHWQERKAIMEYMRQHPETVEEVRMKVGEQ